MGISGGRERRFLEPHRRLHRARRRIVGFLPSAGRYGGGRVGDPRFRLVYKVGPGGAPVGGALEEVVLRMGVLVSARPFSGGGAPRASPSSRSRCRCLRSGGVLEICWIPPGPCRRRARRWGCRAERGWLRPWLSVSKTDAGRWWCWRGRVCAVLVQRPRLRRCAADGFCGALLMRCPRAVAGRWVPVFFPDDGGAADGCSALYPLRMYVFTWLLYGVLCTSYSL